MRISDWSSDVCSSDLLQSIDTENIQPLIFFVRSDGASGRRALANDFDGVAFFKNKCRHGHARQPGKTSAAILRPRVRHLQLSPAQIGRAHVCTPVTNAHLVCRLLLEKKNASSYSSFTCNFSIT